MTVLEVKKIFEPGLHFVGGTRGLILNVGQRGSRSWILRFTASNGKRRDMGLGSYPDVGLKEDIRGHRNAHELVVFPEITTLAQV